MTSTDDKAYLAKIDGETKEQRRRRLNKLSQQRRREKLKILAPAATSSEPLASKLPAKNVQAFQKAIDKLNAFIRTNAKVKDLPAINQVIARLPSNANLIKTASNCKDLENQIQAAEEKGKEINPDKGAEPKTVKAYMVKLTNLYKYMTGKQLDCTNLDWVKDTDKVLKFIDTFDKWPKDNTKNSYRIMLSSLLRNLAGYQKEHLIYSAASTKEGKKISKQIGENKLTEDQKKKECSEPLSILS